MYYCMYVHSDWRLTTKVQGLRAPCVAFRGRGGYGVKCDQAQWSIAAR